MASQIETTVLENGVRVLSEYMEGIRAVSVGVLAGVGSRDETPEEDGFAHLLEHMIFQGTGDRDARAIAEMMEIGGGAIGAFTTREYTVYHATVLDDYLPFALEALGDMLGNSVLPQEALDRQREVILSEMSGNDSPIRRVNNILKSTLWPDHGLGKPTIGNPEALKAADRDSLLGFMKKHYTGKNLILAAAGNVQHSNLVSQVRDALWQIDNGGSATKTIPTPPAATNKVIAEHRDFQQVYFTLAWPAPPYASPDRYTWHVFSSLFGGGPTSRLYRKLREERGMVYQISAQYQAYRDTGVFVIEGATRPETLVPVLAGILLECINMMQEPVNLEDYHRTTQSLISQHLVSGDSAYVRMSRLVLQAEYFKQVVTSDEVIKGLRIQSPETIQQIALNTFSAGQPVTALVGPVTPPLLTAVGEMFADFGDEAPHLELLTRDAPETRIPARNGRKLTVDA